MRPDAPEPDKARHLRVLYRQHNPELREHAPGKFAVDQVRQAEQTRVLNAEFDRLYPGEERTLLAVILQSAWTEAREMAGQRYDYTAQCWRDAEGNRID